MSGSSEIVEDGGTEISQEGSLKHFTRNHPAASFAQAQDSPEMTVPGRQPAPGLWQPYVLSCVVALFLAVNGQGQNGTVFLASYKGTPYVDARYHGGAQQIPGRVECAYYDLGGDGVAYHDTDPQNHGSGELNPADGSYLNEFRMHEGVDTSYTKFGRTPDKIDDNPYNLVQPPAEQIYVGWTVPGEWFNLTVDVAKSGLYSMSVLYTAHNNGSLSFDVNGVPQSQTIDVKSTFNAAEPVPWRQWHHWNLAGDASPVRLTAGRNVLTVHIASGGQMNLAYLDFRPAP